MNCNTVRKFVYAFADGELGTRDSLEALEHLNMCSRCAAKIDLQHHLKYRLQKHFARETAPDHLAAGIIARLDSLDNPQRPASKSSKFLLWAPSAVAAALAVVFLGAYLSRHYVNQADNLPYTSLVFDARTVANIISVHDRCRSTDHFKGDSALGTDLAGIAGTLTEQLRAEQSSVVVIAPDLAPFGYRLCGAEKRGVFGRDGGHILYQSSEGAWVLSVFSIKPIPSVPSECMMQCRNRNYFCHRGNVSIVAWQGPETTYLLCSDMPFEDMLDISDSIRCKIERALHRCGNQKTD